MTYILKYVIQSRYFGYVRVYYKEFETYQEMMSFCYDNQIKKFDVYIKESYVFCEVE